MDLNGYKLVFEDDFNGTELDLEKWSHRAIGNRRCGINSEDAVRVENGNLIIKYDYRDGKYGNGYYGHYGYYGTGYHKYYEEDKEPSKK